MSKSRTVRLVSKVNAEVVVHLHPAVLRVDVDDEHHGALGGIVIFQTLHNIGLEEEKDELTSKLNLSIFHKQFNWSFRRKGNRSGAE